MSDLPQSNEDRLRERILDSLVKIYDETNNLGQSADEIMQAFKAELGAAINTVIGRDLNWTDVMTPEMHESHSEYRDALLRGVQMINEHKIEQRGRADKLRNHFGIGEITHE